MKKIILINAVYPEEKRVAIVEGDTLSDFYVESSAKEHLKGNIYKGVITRIEPGIQAVFVDFGPKKHGFLQIREIMPENFINRQEGKRPRVQDVLQKGQELIVQVEKDERDTKGATLTTYISLPGRYIVMMPGQTRVGISRKIEAREDRDRLKDIFASLKLPKDMGFILRTACSDRTGEELSSDLKYLTRLWSRIKAESKKIKAPALIYKEQDIAVRTVRDYLTSDVAEVLIDDEEAYRKTKEFLRKTLPWRKINISLYREQRPIFSEHRVEEQIAKIHERHVYLPSKGYLVFDKTEALTAIDVNSGRSRREETVESTALRTNLEAADEAARQLRLRDIGGLIVIDFIDMVSLKNRREVEIALKNALQSDKAHAEITGISKFGMVEMTRERMRPAYLESINKKCPTCEGEGIIRSDETVALSALREIHEKASSGRVKSITLRLPVESANYLVNAKRRDISFLEQESGVKIAVLTDTGILPGQFTLEAETQEVPPSPQSVTPPGKAAGVPQRAEAGISKQMKEKKKGRLRPKKKSKETVVMSMAEGLERLARHVPGVSGYLDREGSRATDKAVRLRLSEELEGVKKDIETEVKALVDAGHLTLMPALDTLNSEVDKLCNLIKYASYGYRGFFDVQKVSQEKLDRLYAFDLGLFDEVESIKKESAGLHRVRGDEKGIREALQRLTDSLNALEKTFATRQAHLSAE